MGSRALVVGLALFPAIAAVEFSHTMKEAFGVRITAPAQTRARFVVVSHGLSVYKTTAFAPQFGGHSIVHDTLSAPASLSIAGIGDVELISLDPAVKVTVTAEGLYGSSMPKQSVTASHVQIQHHDFSHSYAINAIVPKPR